jgi:hypothetical protein
MREILEKAMVFSGFVVGPEVLHGCTAGMAFLLLGAAR